jgi:ribose transport system substrate-binding protein
MRKKRRNLMPFAAALSAAMIVGNVSVVAAQNGPAGLTEPMVFPPFDASAPTCAAPPALEKVLAFARDNKREFMLGVDRGLARAAGDRGLGYKVVDADNDAQRMTEQVDALAAERIGAVVAAPVDSVALAPSLQRLIWSGSYVGTVVPPPATSLLNAPQYLTGKALGDAAAAYIRDRLGGVANVVILTHDSLEFLAPRFTAMRDSLASVPGAIIVADISPVTVDKAGGHATMKTVLLANPDIDVVLGADTVVRSTRRAKQARPDRTSSSAESTARSRPSPSSRRPTARIRPASASLRRSSAMQWVSMLPTGSRERAFPRRWISCRRCWTVRTYRNMRRTRPIPVLSMPTRSAATSISRCTATSATTRAIAM